MGTIHAELVTDRGWRQENVHAVPSENQTLEGQRAVIGTINVTAHFPQDGRTEIRPPQTPHEDLETRSVAL